MSFDPFTRTPGIAGKAYIDMHYSDKIIENFEAPQASKFVYKIVGLRGCGKSVEYGKTIAEFKNKPGWLTYTLSAAGNPTETLIAKLSKEPFIDEKLHDTSVTASIAAGVGMIGVSGEASGNYTQTSRFNDNYYSPEATLADMLEKANQHGYKVLVGVDDIAKTPEMVKFLSIWGTQLLEQRQVFLLCTGLSKNIEDFSSESNLTFFKRGDAISISSLDKFEVAAMYQKLLGLNEETAVEMAKCVKGYAYAYQVLGSLYANKNENETIEDLLPELDRILFRDSYDLIWASLTEGEKELVKCIFKSETGKVTDIKSRMETPANFDVMRDRLNKKHLVDIRTRGYLTIDLPRFERYLDLWQSE